MADLSVSDSKDENHFELEKRLRELNSWLSAHRSSPSVSANRLNINDGDDGRDDRSQGKTSVAMSSRSGQGSGQGQGQGRDAKSHRDGGYESDADSLTAPQDTARGKQGDAKDTDAGRRYDSRRCTITCFNPDGSPLQGTTCTSHTHHIHITCMTVTYCAIVRYQCNLIPFPCTS